MNSETNKPGTANPDTLDTILAHEQELVPSSGFLARVMDKVQEEAAAPPPIPFPWKRALPGMAFAAGVLGCGAYEMVHYALRAPGRFTLPALHLPAAAIGSVEQAAWVAGAFALAAAGWLVSRRLAGRSGLL